MKNRTSNFPYSHMNSQERQAECLSFKTLFQKAWIFLIKNFHELLIHKKQSPMVVHCGLKSKDTRLPSISTLENTTLIESMSTSLLTLEIKLSTVNKYWLKWSLMISLNRVVNMNIPQRQDLYSTIAKLSLDLGLRYKMITPFKIKTTYQSTHLILETTRLKATFIWSWPLI